MPRIGGIPVEGCGEIVEPGTTWRVGFEVVAWMGREIDGSEGRGR